MASNGLYAVRKSEEKLTAVFIDEEVLEMEQLNRMTHRNCQAAQRKEAQRMAALEEQRKADLRWKRNTIRLIKQEVKLLIAVIVVGVSLYYGLVAAAFAVPVLVYFQSVICFRAGKYFGKYFRRGRV